MSHRSLWQQAGVLKNKTGWQLRIGIQVAWCGYWKQDCPSGLFPVIYELENHKQICRTPHPAPGVMRIRRLDSSPLGTGNRRKAFAWVVLQGKAHAVCQATTVAPQNRP